MVVRSVEWMFQPAFLRWFSTMAGNNAGENENRIRAMPVSYEISPSTAREASVGANKISTSRNFLTLIIGDTRPNSQTPLEQRRLLKSL